MLSRYLSNSVDCSVFGMEATEGLSTVHYFAIMIESVQVSKLLCEMMLFRVSNEEVADGVWSACNVESIRDATCAADTTSPLLTRALDFSKT